MNTPVFDKLAFLYDYVTGDENYWTLPWLTFARLADDINQIGHHHRRAYRPFIATFTFINNGDFDAVQL